MKKVLLCYASTGGNTHTVCEEVHRVLESNGLQVDLRRVEVTEVEDFEPYEYIVLGSPTYGHGLLEPRMERFVYKRGKDLDLSGKKCAVLGLGDPKYDDDYLVESVAILWDYARERGGKMIAPTLRVVANPIPQLTTLVRPWAEQLARLIKENIKKNQDEI